MASRIIPGEEKQNLLGQVPPISMSVPNPLTTTSDIPSSTINQNAFASDNTNYVFPLLRQNLLKGYVPPSTPNPGTYIPSLPRSQRKSPSPHLSMLNKADLPPSAPNPGTYIPS